MKCPSCGAENPDGAEYCNLCMSTVGFDNPEFGSPPPFDEGFSNKYPSSFSDDAPVPPPEEFTRQPTARPVEIGQYGERSGETVPDVVPRDPGDAEPLDIGQYGERSGERVPDVVPRDQGDAEPLDIGQYGVPSGHEQKPPEPSDE